MIRIICPNCKNAYLENKDDALVCPSCAESFATDTENLLLGIQYYNECDYDKANDCLMKFIVKNGADPQAIFYKALCDGFCYDEDTLSLADTYTKLFEALKDIPKELFPTYLALANDETEKLERAVAQSHIHLFVEADAEKIKKEVSTIINLQNEAKAFRIRLNALTNEYNDTATAKLSVKFSECYLVDPELATQVGNLKYEKITENIASHTVFTGILSTEIKNLEIYYRCIVMFFKKNRPKYLFLLESADKFTELAKLLEEGKYTSIKGTEAIGNKLRSASYDFLQESLKDADDDFLTQEQTVVILEAVTEEEAEEAADFEDISSTSAEAVAEETEPEASPVEEEEAEEAVADEDQSEEASVIELSEEADTADEEEAEESDETAEAVEVVEIADAVAEEAVVEEVIEETAEEAVTEEKPKEATEEAVAEEATEEAADETANESVEDAVIDIEKTDIEAIPDSHVEDIEQAQQPMIKKKRKKSYAPFITAFLILAGIIAIICITVIPAKINEGNYATAEELMGKEQYQLAADVYADLGDYEDSQEKLKLAKYNYASQLEAQEKFDEAKAIYVELDNYEDSMARASSCTYNSALATLDAGKFDEAKAMFESIPDYADSKNQALECDYQKAASLVVVKEYAQAIGIFESLADYSDSKTKVLDAKYKYVNDHLSKDDKTTIAYLEDLIEARYLDSVAVRRKLLGASAVTSGVSTCINYSETDMAEDLTEADRTKPIYFHITVADAELYGKQLTVKFTTSVGYTERKHITLTRENNTYSLMYPRTTVSNYTVDFSLATADGTEIAKQTITIK